MRTVRVYSEQGLQAGTTQILSGEPAHHLHKVLRMRAGDTLVLFDGSGSEHSATIRALDKKAVTVELGEVTTPATESPLRVSLWHGICRSSRMDYVVQKATELGVSAIQPVITERSVVRLDADRARSRTDHWRKVSISAAEQSGRNRLPELSTPLPLEDCLTGLAAGHTAVMLHPAGTTKLTDLLTDVSELILLTGPEGGFSDAECDMATRSGFQLATLGPRILRSETAPVAALAIAQTLAGDLG